MCSHVLFSFTFIYINYPSAIARAVTSPDVASVSVADGNVNVTSLVDAESLSM